MKYDDADEVLAKLSKQARVAIACAYVEHVRELYRCGNVRCTIADVGDPSLPFAADKDVLEAGLELAWSFALSGTTDSANAKTLARWLGAKFLGKRAEANAAGAVGALKGLHYALLAIEDESTRSVDQAMSQTEVGVSISLSQLGLGDDDEDDVPQEASDQEEAWQLRVIEHVVANGSKPLTRELFAELLAEDPFWKEYLGPYKAKFQR